MYFPLATSAAWVRSRPVSGKQHPTLTGLRCLLLHGASALTPDARWSHGFHWEPKLISDRAAAIWKLKLEVRLFILLFFTFSQIGLLIAQHREWCRRCAKGEKSMKACCCHSDCWWKPCPLRLFPGRLDPKWIAMAKVLLSPPQVIASGCVVLPPVCTHCWHSPLPWSARSSVIFPLNCFTESAGRVAEKEAGLCAQKRHLQPHQFKLPLIAMKPRLLSHLADRMLFKKVGSGSGPPKKKKKRKVKPRGCLHCGQLWKSTSFLLTWTLGTF